jgi:predicted ATPase/DNA-binding winged helix-turn-helix (wHTH) protein
MIFRFGDHELDQELFELRRRGERVPTQPKILELMFLLTRHHGRVVGKQEIFDAVWPGVSVSEASLNRAVMEARRALDDSSHNLITTVRGRGFRLKADVVEVADGGARERHPANVDGARRPPLIGREAQVALFGARLGETLGGVGGFLSVCGEAGVGKSRLLEELSHDARARMAIVSTVRCREAEGAPPYWPWVQLTRSGALPNMGALEESLSLAAQGEFTAHDAFTSALLRAIKESRAQALVLLVDDLDLADIPSLKLLLFVVRHCRQSPLLVVGAYRNASPAEPERARLLGALARDSSSQSMLLEGLSRADMGKLIEELTGRKPSPDTEGLVWEKAAGNPFYLQQLLQTHWAQRLLRPSSPAPASSIDLQPQLLESIAGHYDALSAECQRMLTVAAVLGREFSFATLASVGGFASEVLLALLDEAVHERIVLKTRSELYRFSHVLIRDVLYKKLREPDRVALHRAAGEALLLQYGNSADAHAGELAQHFLRAAPGGTAERAIEYARRAAWHAEARGAYAEAATQYERALGAFAFAKNDERRAEVQLALARARLRAGDADLARVAFLDAAITARAARLPVSFAEAALGYVQLGELAEPQHSLLQEARATLLADAASGSHPGLLRELDDALGARNA